MALHCWFSVFFLVLPQASRLGLLPPLAKAQGTGQPITQVTDALVQETGPEQQDSAAGWKGLEAAQTSEDLGLSSVPVTKQKGLAHQVRFPCAPLLKSILGVKSANLYLPTLCLRRHLKMPQRIALCTVQITLRKYNYLVCLCVHHWLTKTFTRPCHILKTLVSFSPRWTVRGPHYVAAQLPCECKKPEDPTGTGSPLGFLTLGTQGVIRNYLLKLPLKLQGIFGWTQKSGLFQKKAEFRNTWKTSVIVISTMWKKLWN